MGYIILFVIIILIFSGNSSSNNNNSRSINSVINDSDTTTCDLKETKIPNTTVEIKDSAFWNNKSIEKIKIPISVIKIGYNAFGECSNLKKVEIPTSVTEIGEYAFRNCSNLKEIKIPSSVTKISKCMFFKCSNLEKVEIPNSVIEIESSAFWGSNLKEVKIPNSTVKIERLAFGACRKLEKIEIPDSVIRINESTFLDSPNVCIYCNKYSYAEEYAKENNIKYKYITDTEYEYINSTSNKSAKAIKLEKEIDNNYKKQKNEANNQDAEKIEFLSAQGTNIINQILNTTYDQHFDKLDTTTFNYDMRVSIFNKKLDRVNGNKLEYANALKRNILYYYNLNKDMYEYISSCIKNKKFPESVSQWQAPFTQLEIKNKITDINKARNKERLDVYERFEH